MYALITRDLSTIRKTASQVTPIDPAQLDPAKPYWVPINTITNDISTGSEIVREGPVTTIYANRVEKVTTIRDKTAQELDTQDQNAVDRIASIGSIDYAQFQLLFQIVNDVRTLKGQGTITAQQFKTYVKGLIRA